MAHRKILVPLWLFGACLIFVGLTLAISGFYLISLGGSAYYFTFGLLLMVSGALVCRTRASGAWVYLAAFSLTLGWAFWEVGLDVWRLLPGSMDQLRSGSCSSPRGSDAACHAHQ